MADFVYGYAADESACRRPPDVPMPQANPIEVAARTVVWCTAPSPIHITIVRHPMGIDVKVSVGIPVVQRRGGRVPRRGQTHGREERVIDNVIDTIRRASIRFLRG